MNSIKSDEYSGFHSDLSVHCTGFYHFCGQATYFTQQQEKIYKGQGIAQPLLWNLLFHAQILKIP